MDDVELVKDDVGSGGGGGLEWGRVRRVLLQLCKFVGLWSNLLSPQRTNPPTPPATASPATAAEYVPPNERGTENGNDYLS